MPLQVWLKQGDTLLVGTARITVASNSGTRLVIEGDMPIFKESDIIEKEEATTPFTMVLYHAQQHYLTKDPEHLKAVSAIAMECDPEIAQEIKHLFQSIEEKGPANILRHARKHLETPEPAAMSI